MIAVNSPGAEADADVVERGDGGVAGAVALADADGPGRGGGWSGRGRCVVRTVIWFSWGWVASAVGGVSPAHAVPRRAAHRAGRTPPGAGRRAPGRADRAASPTPGVRVVPSRGAADAAQTARMTSGEPPARRHGASGRPSRVVVVGLVRLRGRRVRRRGRSGGGADRADVVADLALSVLATAVVALGFDPVQSRLEASALARRARRPAVAVRRPEPVLRDGDRAVRGRGAARRGWPGCWPRAPARSGSQVWLVGGRPASSWPRPGRPRPPRPRRRRGVDASAGPAGPARCGTAASVLGVLRLQERDECR